MSIENKIKQIDLERFAIKLHINSNYSNSKEIGDLYDKSHNLRIQKINLLKQLERKEKLNRING